MHAYVLRVCSMIHDEALSQGYIYIHLARLFAVVTHSVMCEFCIFILVTSSAFIYMRATVEISSMLDELSVSAV